MKFLCVVAPCYHIDPSLDHGLWLMIVFSYSSPIKFLRQNCWLTVWAQPNWAEPLGHPLGFRTSRIALVPLWTALQWRANPSWASIPWTDRRWKIISRRWRWGQGDSDFLPLKIGCWLFWPLRLVLLVFVLTLAFYVDLASGLNLNFVEQIGLTGDVLPHQSGISQGPETKVLTSCSIQARMLKGGSDGALKIFKLNVKCMLEEVLEAAGITFFSLCAAMHWYVNPRVVFLTSFNKPHKLKVLSRHAHVGPRHRLLSEPRLCWKDECKRPLGRRRPTGLEKTGWPWKFQFKYRYRIMI